MNTFLPTRQLCSVPSIFRSVSSIILCREPLLEHTESNDIDVRDIVRKPSDKVYLLVKKPRRNNAWQFPQGGQEKGETKAEAALRELKEECGRDLKVTMSNHTSVGSYQYRFPRCFIAYNKRKYNDAAIGAKISFFKATWISGQCHPDQIEIVDFAWLTRDEIWDYVNPEYKTAIQTLI